MFIYLFIDLVIIYRWEIDPFVWMLQTGGQNHEKTNLFEVTYKFRANTWIDSDSKNPQYNSQDKVVCKDTTEAQNPVSSVYLLVNTSFVEMIALSSGIGDLAHGLSLWESIDQIVLSHQVLRRQVDTARRKSRTIRFHF